MLQFCGKDRERRPCYLFKQANRKLLSILAGSQWDAKILDKVFDKLLPNYTIPGKVPGLKHLPNTKEKGEEVNPQLCMTKSRKTVVGLSYSKKNTFSFSSYLPIFDRSMLISFYPQNESQKFIKLEFNFFWDRRILSLPMITRDGGSIMPNEQTADILVHFHSLVCTTTAAAFL